MKEQYNLAHLEKNISDMIYEGMVKIGYIENQSVSVYYDPGLLCYLLHTDRLTNEEMAECLEEFKQYVIPRLGSIAIKYAKGRYEFCVCKDGVKYIYENNQSRGFLPKLVEVLQNRENGLEQIIKVFREVSENIRVEEVEHSEFQYVISFEDKQIDEFRYCFTFDEMGRYYHRLLDYDFEKVVHCDC